MKLDMVVKKGGSGKPVAIFIHGLGMDANWWAEPSKARAMGGLASLSFLLKSPEPRRTLFHDAVSLGWTAVAWSQRRPVGPISVAVEELRAIIRQMDTGSGVILVGHSRGGLIARVYIEEAKPRFIKGLLTLSTPHLGSSMAKFATYLGPLASVLDSLVPQRGRVSKSVKKMLGFFESRGVRELLPGSELIASLEDRRPEGVYCLSAGGTNPALIHVAGFFFLPEALGRVLPEALLPDEMLDGKGDGLVSLRSSRLPFADEHLDFYLNHAEILFDPGAREAIVERMRLIV